jgi:hypothetical protein
LSQRYGARPSARIAAITSCSSADGLTDSRLSVAGIGQSFSVVHAAAGGVILIVAALLAARLL